MKTVLIIDDEAAIRRALQRVVERAGYQVRTAANGAEGLAELRAGGADVVITDIIMPGINGVDTIRAIARDYPDVRIVAISGGGNYGVAEYRPEAIATSAFLAVAKDAGAHAILTKPFQIDDVVRAIGG